MYYSAFDLQVGDYFHTGRNSKTKKECIEDIFLYLTQNQDSDEEESMFKTKKLSDKLSIVYSYEVRIDEHKELLFD